MNSLLSILQPPSTLAAIHQRLGEKLSRTRHAIALEVDLLDECTKARPPVAERPSPMDRSVGMSRRVMVAISDEPQTVSDLHKRIGGSKQSVQFAVWNLVKRGSVRNLSRHGAIGKFVRWPTQRGVFDL